MARIALRWTSSCGTHRVNGTAQFFTRYRTPGSLRKTIIGTTTMSRSFGEVALLSKVIPNLREVLGTIFMNFVSAHRAEKLVLSLMADRHVSGVTVPSTMDRTKTILPIIR